MLKTNFKDKMHELSEMFPGCYVAKVRYGVAIGNPTSGGIIYWSRNRYYAVNHMAHTMTDMELKQMSFERLNSIRIMEDMARWCRTQKVDDKWIVYEYGYKADSRMPDMIGPSTIEKSEEAALSCKELFNACNRLKATVYEMVDTAKCNNLVIVSEDGTRIVKSGDNDVCIILER